MLLSGSAVFNELISKTGVNPPLPELLLMQTDASVTGGTVVFD